MPHAHFFAQRRLGVDAYDIYGRVIESFEGDSAKMPLRRRHGPGGPAAGAATDRARADRRPVRRPGGARRARATRACSVKVPDFNGTLRVSALVYCRRPLRQGSSESIVRAPIVAEVSAAARPGAGRPQHGDPGRAELHRHSRRIQGAASMPRARSTIGKARRKVTLGDGGQDHAELPADRAARATASAQVRVRGGRRRLQGRPRVRRAGARRLARRCCVRARRCWTPGAGVRAGRRCRGGPDAGLGECAHDGQRAAADSVRQRAAGRAGVSRTAAPSRPPARATRRCCWTTTPRQRMGVKGLDAGRRGASAWKARSAAWRRCRSAAGTSRCGAVIRYVDPILTPYIVEFLLDAREAGFAVPDAMLQKALERLERRPADRRRAVLWLRPSRSPALRLPGAGRLRAGAGQPRAAGHAARAVRQRARQGLTGLPLVHLGIALTLQGDKARGKKAIAEGFAKKDDRPWYLGDYGSSCATRP